MNKYSGESLMLWGLFIFSFFYARGPGLVQTHDIMTSSNYQQI